MPITDIPLSWFWIIFIDFMCNQCQMSQIYILHNVKIYLIRIVYKTWYDPLHHFSGQPLSTSYITVTNPGSACFAEILSEFTKTWSSDATECRLCIGNCNVNVWKSTEYKLHKIWRWLKCQQNEHTPANKSLINLYISWLYSPFLIYLCKLIVH